ncbi:hypothetical protein ACFQ1S_17025, partial [Kibdelosporangium lantanae]
PDHCFVAKLSMQNDPHGYFDVRPDDQPCYNDGGVSWHFDWARRPRSLSRSMVTSSSGMIETLRPTGPLQEVETGPRE